MTIRPPGVLRAHPSTQRRFPGRFRALLGELRELRFKGGRLEREANTLRIGLIIRKGSRER